MTDQLDKAFWDQLWDRNLRDHGDAMGARGPNAQLIAEATELTPGTALDAGCGQGTDAIWLAARGWQVTAVDFVTAALGQARERADAFGADISARIDWVQADLNTWTPPAETFDLVSCHYVHGVAPRDALFRRLASAVAPGGTLLVVGHHPEDRTSTSHSAAPELYFTAEEVAACLEPGRTR